MNSTELAARLSEINEKLDRLLEQKAKRRRQPTPVVDATAKAFIKACRAAKVSGHDRNGDSRIKLAHVRKAAGWEDDGAPYRAGAVARSLGLAVRNAGGTVYIICDEAYGNVVGFPSAVEVAQTLLKKTKKIKRQPVHM